jgi:putative membrane protein
MKTIKKVMIRAAAICLTLGLNTACSNKSEAENSKEHAEEMNEEKLDREGEKDADRLSEAHMGNLFEIQASQDAMSKATTADVKKLAGMMVEAHSKMDRDLQDLAGRKNITLPAAITDAQKRDLDRLNEKTGIDFDKEYTDIMKNKHEDAVKLFEKLSEKAEDQEIKQMAATTLPEIRSHLDMIEATRNNVKDMKADARKDNDMPKGKDAHDGKTVDNK